MTTSKIYLAATGMLTPVGFDSASTNAAIAAGLSAYEDSMHHNKNFNPMRMALIPEDALPPLNPELISLTGLTSRQRRILRIATPAIQEVITGLPLKEPPALFLALPESIPDSAFSIHPKFLDALEIQTNVKFDKTSSRIFATGRAGGIEAIDLVFKYFEATGKDVAIVGGVDTYLDHLLLGVLDKDNRILAENISDGFAPGEAAGFLLLVSERVKNYLPHPPKAEIFRPGLANEPGHRYSEEPYRGDGLANAFQLAIKNSDGKPIDAIYASLNGENFGAKELGIAFMRNKSAFAENTKTEHPADCFGDIGAAFGPVLIANALASKQNNVLCYCSSETQTRAAIVVARLTG
jgi:3-oxoacyl-[acyl-carrier-protein] synthase-1